jgi:hypothetical protein
MRPKPSAIVRAACEITGAKPADVLGNHHKPAPPAARAARILIAAYCRHCTNEYALRDISRILGRRDHHHAHNWLRSFDDLPIIEQIEHLETIHARLHSR